MLVKPIYAIEVDTKFIEHYHVGQYYCAVFPGHRNLHPGDKLILLDINDDCTPLRVTIDEINLTIVEDLTLQNLLDSGFESYKEFVEYINKTKKDFNMGSEVTYVKWDRMWNVL
jgi:hypothetical protein